MQEMVWGRTRPLQVFLIWAASSARWATVVSFLACTAWFTHNISVGFKSLANLFCTPQASF